MIVLDTNILMELLERRRFYEHIVAAFGSPDFRGAELAVSTLTVSNTFYLAESHKVPMSRVEALFRPYCVLDVLGVDSMWALSNYRGKDFEDALQIAVAIREGATSFVTIDSSLAAKYSDLIPVRLIR